MKQKINLKNNFLKKMSTWEIIISLLFSLTFWELCSSAFPKALTMWQGLFN